MDMDTLWFDRYVGAWLLHPRAGAPAGESELKALLDCYSPDVRYEDVPTAIVFEGHDGIKRMCEGAHNWSSDLEATAVTRQTNGTLFAVETEWKGTNTAATGDHPATGQRFTLRVLSVGTTNDQGLVTEHRDYWDLASFLAQVGTGPGSR
jgi:steroid delta-isomerase-like uncharacterized protein